MGIKPNGFMILSFGHGLLSLLELPIAMQGTYSYCCYDLHIFFIIYIASNKMNQCKLKITTH